MEVLLNDINAKYYLSILLHIISLQQILLRYLIFNTKPRYIKSFSNILIPSTSITFYEKSSYNIEISCFRSHQTDPVGKIWTTRECFGYNSWNILRLSGN